MLGKPLASEEELGERLSKRKALAIFSSDAISSSAYATEEILRALLLSGVALTALAVALPISVAIAALLAIVAFSYRQVCIAYPNGGGSYTVSKVNFGRIASLVAASALLIDYNLTVAVSTSSAVEQVISAFPAVAPASVAIGVTAIGLITIGNLRGLREAGNIFAVPTYLFLFGALVMIAMGAYRIIVLGETSMPPGANEAATDVTQAVGALVLLRAFASGAVALTGTEAIATGVPAFKPPESKNAATTLMVMAGILAVLFVGITFLATNFGIVPIDEPVKQTVISQVAATVFGGDSIGFYLFQTFTALLLFLAANTCFAAFPRLAAVLGQDGFFPRQFSFRGDRLAFSGGIIALGIIAASLVVIFQGDTHALIPLPTTSSIRACGAHNLVAERDHVVPDPAGRPSALSAPADPAQGQQANRPPLLLHRERAVVIAHEVVVHGVLQGQLGRIRSRLAAITSSASTPRSSCCSWSSW